jgi:hypothetical protein
VTVSSDKAAREDCGGGAGLALVEAAIDVVDIVHEIEFDDGFGRVDANCDVERNAVGQNSCQRIMPPMFGHFGLRKRLDGADHALFGIVEPVVHEGFDGFLSIFRAEFLETAFGRARCADTGQEIAVPLVRLKLIEPYLDLGRCDAGSHFASPSL